MQIFDVRNAISYFLAKPHHLLYVNKEGKIFTSSEDLSLRYKEKTVKVAYMGDYSSHVARSLTKDVLGLL